MEVSFIKLSTTITWPPLEDGKVVTKRFLDSSEVILKFFDTLGKLYSPVKNDVAGNIMKLHSKYSQDPVRYNYIHDMIADEVYNRGGHASDSLLWLKRGLHFVYLFLQSLVHDHENNVTSEDLLENVRKSYDLALKPYHNWVLQKLFLILSRAAPKRQELFKSMMNTAGDIDDNELVSNVKVFVEGLKTNLEAIFDLYVFHKLDTCQLALLSSGSQSSL